MDENTRFFGYNLQDFGFESYLVRIISQGDVLGASARLIFVTLTGSRPYF